MRTLSTATPQKSRQTRRSALDKLEKEQLTLGLDSFTSDEDGGITVDLDALDADPIAEEKESLEHTENLVDQFDEDFLRTLGNDVKQNVERDRETQGEREDMIARGSSLLGLKLEEKNHPFQGACSAQHPLLMESAVKFQSKASNELLPANGPVRCAVLGEVTLEKEQQANRVMKHMNYQILEEMTEFYGDTEKLLLYVALFGSGFKKVYYSEDLGRPVSEFVPADQLIIADNAPDLYRAGRYTHILYKSKDDLEKDFAAKLYRKPQENTVNPSTLKFTEIQESLNNVSGVEVSFNDNTTGYTLYEQHVTMYLDGVDNEDDEGFEIAKPYVITVDSDSGEVLGIRRNWREKDVKKRKKVPFIHYQFVPGFGFYGLGFLHLLGNLQLSLTSALRSLVDAGQFSNLQGGFKLKGVRILNDGEPISPGQFKDVDSGILDINKSIMRLPFGEPSSVLYQMLEFLDRKGQKFADATEQVMADSTNYGPVGTTLALLDASTKFFSAIHKRLHASLKGELKLIAEINGETLPDDLKYNIRAESMQISREDYSDTVDIVPVSDPNVSSNAHRMAKAQTILQVAQMSPDLHDMREVLKHFYIAMDFTNVDKILPDPEQAQAQDPITDIQLAVQGKPIKAFPGQDHKSHIVIKQAFLQDPMSGKNPMMQKAAVVLQGNIQEHMLLNFQEQLQAMGGAPEEAAPRLAQMNQQKLEQDLKAQEASPQDQAAMLLAKAELLDTETQAKKQSFDEKFKVAELELAKEELDMKKIQEARRSDEFNKKIMADMNKVVTTKGLDAMIQGLDNRNKQKDKEDGKKDNSNKDK